MIRFLLALLIASLPACAFGQLAAAVSFADSRPPSGASEREFDFLQSTSSDANETTYTFSSQNFGTADANRFIIVTVQCRAASGLTLNSATIGGVSADIDAQHTSANNTVAVISAAVPTGTSGDIVVTFSGGAVRAAAQVYRAVGGALNSHDTETGTSLSAGTINIPTNGILVAGGVNTSTTEDHIWTGVTERDEYSVESQITVSTASDDLSEETDRDVDCDSGSSVVRAMVSYALTNP